MKSLGRVASSLALIAITGIASAAYVLVHERAPNPLLDTYPLHITLRSADGVAPGLGQPVRVAGVKVGTITAMRHHAGNAQVTVAIQRNQLPRIYRDATATLEPITPLKDMQISLDPGHRDAGPLGSHRTISIASTRAPVPLSDLLSVLDTDTRSFLASLLSSLEQGVGDKGQQLRAALRTLAPTTADVRRLAAALDGRRTELARLVHNLAEITTAASHDRQLGQLVGSANVTLRVLAENDRPLKDTLARLPGTLADTRQTLARAATFSRHLTPTLDALLPAVQQLPRTLPALQRFADAGTETIDQDLIRLVSRAQPVVRDVAPATTALSHAAPSLTRAFQVTEYLVNVLAHNPPGDDEGHTYWTSWFAHNFNSVFSSSDGNGGFGRASVFVDCALFTGLLGVDDVLKQALGVTDLCNGMAKRAR